MASTESRPAAALYITLLVSCIKPLGIMALGRVFTCVELHLLIGYFHYSSIRPPQELSLIYCSPGARDSSS